MEFQTEIMNQETTIERLPNEILEIIFDNVLASSSSDVNLLLVLRRWKNIIESRHVFERSSFFASLRNEDEFRIAVNSPRRFKKFFISHDNSNNIDPDWLQVILKRNEKTLEEIKLIFDIMQDTVDFKLFYLILKSLKSAKTIDINFKWMKITENSNFDSAIISFEKLENLTINWSSGERVVAKIMLNFMRVPKLKYFHFYSNSYGTTELNDIFEFVNGNSKELKDICMWSKNFYKFEWKPEFLHILYHPHMEEGLEKLLQNRSKNLKIFKVFRMRNRDFNARILNEATDLIEFVMSDSPPFDIHYLLTIRADFPHIKVLRIAYEQHVAAETKHIFTFNI